MLMKLTIGVNIINIFSCAFFVRTSFLAAFLVTFQIDAKNLYKKCVQKMLMKLTIGVNIINILLALFANILVSKNCKAKRNKRNAAQFTYEQKMNR